MRNASTEALRHCPLCMQEVSSGNLGLRDYSSWLFDVLPGRVGASDIDAIIEQGGTGRALVLEFKSSKWVPQGQQRLFNRLCAAGFDVWVVIESDPLEACIWRAEHKQQVWNSLALEELKQMVQAWWALGEEAS